MIENDYINGKITSDFYKSDVQSPEQCIVNDTNSNHCEWHPDGKYRLKLKGLFEFLTIVCNQTLNPSAN